MCSYMCSSRASKRKQVSSHSSRVPRASNKRVKVEGKHPRVPISREPHPSPSTSKTEPIQPHKPMLIKAPVYILMTPLDLLDQGFIPANPRTPLLVNTGQTSERGPA